MYILAKIAQAAGLGIVAIGFVAAFPNLINIETLSLGAVLFGAGWVVERYGIRKK